MNKDKNIDDQIREFLAKDPVPELENWEVNILTQRVLARVEKRAPRRFFGIRPAWGIGVVAVAALLLLAIWIAPPQLPEQALMPEDLAVLIIDEEPEDMLYDAISGGELEVETAFAEIIDIDESEAEKIYYSYAEDEIDAAINLLSDEEVENILQYLDEAGYSGKEEVIS